jgi:hypothetical protein
MDFIYLGIIILFFVASLGLVKLCDVLSEHKPGEQP